MSVTHIMVVYYWMSVECKLYFAHAFHLVGARWQTVLLHLALYAFNTDSLYFHYKHNIKQILHIHLLLAAKLHLDI